MDYILVTFRCNEIVEDLKVPAFIPISELIDTFNEIYQAGGKMLHAEPKGIILDKSKTLSAQGIGHGAMLILS